MISSFSFPTNTLHGVGSLDQLPERLARFGMKRPLVVTDRGLLGTDAFRLLQGVVPEGATFFSDVHPNPVEADVVAGVEAWQNGKSDGIIGFGGGSALDVAKILRPAVASSGEKWRDLTWSDDPGPLPPFVAVPTTAGTGSEVGRSSVIIFGKTKRVIFHPALLANLVILDPRVTAGLPPALTAATGVDALTHCIESFTSPSFHPLCDAIALEGARIAFANLPRAVESGNDLEARGMMQIAAAMGGIAFQKDLGAAHSLSHPLSAHFGLHHGLANGLCLLPVMRYNAQHKPGIYHRLGVAIGLEKATDANFIEATANLLQRIGISGGLRAKGIDEASLPTLAEAAFKDSCHLTNPVPVTQADLLELYRAAL
jgi:alcohol dehydrogenase class IV